jgi:hypothetical protein
MDDVKPAGAFVTRLPQERSITEAHTGRDQLSLAEINLLLLLDTAGTTLHRPDGRAQWTLTTCATCWSWPPTCSLTGAAPPSTRRPSAREPPPCSKPWRRRSAGKGGGGERDAGGRQRRRVPDPVAARAARSQLDPAGGHRPAQAPGVEAAPNMSTRIDETVEYTIRDQGLDLEVRDPAALNTVAALILAARRKDGQRDRAAS